MTGELSAKRKNKQRRTADSMTIACRFTECPRLLVSVRSRVEAECAINAGAEILDVKEPSLGSLGMASIDDITEIARAVEDVSGKIPLSVALGEISDWCQSSNFPELPHGITYAKLGMSGCVTQKNWQAEWMRVRCGFQHRSLSKLRWVAVAYADVNRARSPGIYDVLAAAADTDCAGLLIDTFAKDGRRLNDEIDETSLIEIAEACHKAGLFLALAGRLNYESLPLLVNANADVLGIRSAACQDTDRTSKIDPARIAEFKNEMRRCLQAKRIESDLTV